MLEGEEKLIKGASRGNAGDFDRLYSHYIAPIYRFIYMKVTHRQEAEDLAHEVFLNAWQGLPSYQSRGFPFSSWLYHIARNKVIDYYRLKKNVVGLDALGGMVDLAKTETSVETELENNLNLEKIKAAIHKLNHDQQDVLLMRFVEELSYKEISAAIQKSEGAVRLIHHRAVKELKKLLNGANS